MATTTVLSGGNWSAVDRSGVTWYVSGSVSATGAVVFSSINSLIVSSGAVVSGALLSGGIPTVSVLNGGAMISSTEINGYLRVASGGIISGNTLNSDEVTLSAGASSFKDLFLNSGSVADGNAYVYVSSGASLIGATMTNGAQAGLTAYVSSGATVTDLTLGAGAGATVSSGAVVSGTINTGSGSVLSLATAYGSGSATINTQAKNPVILSGGTWSAVLSGATTYYVSGKVSATGPVVLSSISTLVISSGAVVSGAVVSGGIPTVSVTSGGILENSLVLNGYVSALNGATLSSNTLNSDVVTLYSGASSIRDTYINSGSGTDGYSDATVYSGATLDTPYIGSANAGSFTVTVSSGASVANPTLVQSGGKLVVSGGTLTTDTTAPCFLSGTLIETVDGLKAVEDIRIGDRVLTYVATDTERSVALAREVIWAGRTSARIDPGQPDDLSGFPVRVARDALEDGVPFKDLLITAEHCLFIAGAFVPVRMLVNGRTIRYDKAISSYEYYHIETEDHAIIRADGALSESYLDTGNRQSFRQAGKIHAIGSRRLDWHEAAAPLMTGRDFVEPIYRKIASRADAPHDAGDASRDRAITHDPDLYIVTESGEWIGQHRCQNGQYVFALPPGTQDIRLVSNSSRPSDAIAPYLDDRRTLGVLVGDLRIYDSWGTIELADILTSATLDGWNDIEPCGRRWTNGNARVTLPERRPGGIAFLALKIDAAGPYVMQPSIQMETIVAISPPVENGSDRRKFA